MPVCCGSKTSHAAAGGDPLPFELAPGAVEVEANAGVAVDESGEGGVISEGDDEGGD